MGHRPKTAADWAARLHSDRATAQDHAAYEEWLGADPENRAEADSLESLWSAAEALEDDPMVQAVLAPPRRRPKRRFARRAPRLLGAALLCLAVFSVSWMARRHLDAIEVHRTASGEQRVVDLADGSRLHLNVSTQLEVSLRNGFRTVRLVQGQAFFDVASDPSRPFVVTAGDKEITVLGTKFAVQLHGEDTRVTVIEGRVAVTSKGAPEAASPGGSSTAQGPELSAAPGGGAVAPAAPKPRRIELTAQDAIAWARDAAPSPLPSSEAVSTVENWLRGRVVFDKTPLREAVVELDRYTPVRIKLASAELAATPISGVFHIERLANVDSLVFALENSLPIVVEQEADEILLLADG
ncbi:MAG: FecR domain-containing protein [Acidobacteriota bacterium]